MKHEDQKVRYSPILLETIGDVANLITIKQQEPKITAHMSNDEKFIADCAAGKDAYSTIASLANNLPYEQCLEFNPDGTTNKEGKERRGEAKKILLGRPRTKCPFIE